MFEFIINGIFWVLALYGLIEIIKNIIYICTYTNLKSDGIYMIIAVKNQENKIEGFLRNFVFRLIYGKEEQVKNIIIADLNSNDDTNKILNIGDLVEAPTKYGTKIAKVTRINVPENEIINIKPYMKTITRKINRNRYINFYEIQEDAA